MTYTLNTLNAEQVDAHPTGVTRFAQEIGWVLGGAVLLFWWVAMATHHLADPAWSTSGAGGGAIHNWGGRLGAWVADISYYLLGLSVWWCGLVALRAWLQAWARWIRGAGLTAAGVAPAVAPSADARTRWLRRLVWAAAFIGLLSASAVLEWGRLYRWDALLPGQAGGVWGAVLGPGAQKWLGFTGSALLALALAVACVAHVFGFAWGSVAERLGAWLHQWFETRREKREAVEDQRIGQQAAREREAVVHEERVEVEERPPAPVQIEPVMVAVPQSTRVAKERQKPLFKDPTDSKLPQVDLLDAAAAQQASVSPETLEMTSRLIEKKLKDFGVEVRVVAAAPGPVITRYEIEPATGVKGSQVVNLAKDLARSLSLVSVRVIETIPGKNLMALELPNAKRQTIRLSEILGSEVYNDA
ncbi:MAG: hypothetical protein RJA09_1169, partial [Pseudomonadota bacterium]